MQKLINKYAEYVHKVKDQGVDPFFTLFDGGKNFKDAKAIAERNFVNSFLPFAYKYLGGVDDLQKMKSMDIGYGSGLQVATASNYFGQADGIDVHGERVFVEETIRKSGISKNLISLSQDSADNIRCMSDVYDFVHSWVTFLHFPSIEYTKMSLKEIYRILKPLGIAVIYYARLVKTKRMETHEEYEVDLNLEKLNKTGFSAKESLTEVFKKGISIARWKMTELVEEVGFEVLEQTSSNDGGFVFGQHGIVLRKPPIVEPEQIIPPAQKKKIIRRKKSIKKS